MRFLAVAVCIAVLGAPVASTADSIGYTVAATGRMISAASEHRAVRLPSGSVLLTGGQSGEGGLATAQLFNPTTNAFVPLPPMTTPRFVHSATLLKDGRVFIAGGFNKAGQFLQSTEFFDGKGFVKGPSLIENRDNERAVLLDNGRVFLEGGDNERPGYIASTEIFDPSTDSMEKGPNLPIGHAMDSLSRLNDGSILLAGGIKIEGEKVVPLNQIVKFDPKTNSITEVGRLNEARTQHKAIVLSDGNVLFTGGRGQSGELASAEIFDTRSGEVKKVSPMSSPRREHCMANLPNGRVLIAAGYDGSSYLASTEIYDPSTRSFFAGPELHQGRAYPTCTMLKDGSILVAGGTGSGGALDTADIIKVRGN